MTGSRDAHGRDEVVRSEISGAVYGPSVQARDIHGEVYVHREQPRPPRPSQLPPPIRLAGRDGELAALDEMCSAAEDVPAVVVVTGPAGIGKTALGVNWAHASRSRFPDGQIFADLRGHAPDGPASPADVLAQFLRALGVEPEQVPADLAELTAMYRSLTAERRIVAVLDDAVSAAQVAPLLPASLQSVTVVTGRWRLAALLVRGARALTLGRLADEAGVELLARTVGEERVLREPEPARELVGLCAGLPLAVCVAGARLAARPAWSIGEMVGALAEERRRLEVLAVDEEVAVPAALDVSYRALDVQVARAYRLTALWPGPTFESGVAAAAANVGVAEARRLLGVLADANLLEDVPPTAYRFHDLVRLHARERVEREEAEPARDAAARRMLDWYLDTARAAAELILPYRQGPPCDVQSVPPEREDFRDAGEALDWLDRERGNLFAAARHALDRGLPRTAYQLVSALWPLFLRRGLYRERLDFEGIGLDAARRSGDPEAEARMLDRVGLALYELERFDEASDFMSRALTLWRRLEDRHRQASSLRRLGFVAVAGNRLDEAIDSFTGALEAHRALGETRAAALARIDLGDALTRAGRPEEAISRLRGTPALLAEVPDHYNRARALAKLGRAHGLTGELADAADLLHRALRLMRELGSPPGEAEVLETLGELAERAGQPGEARQHYEGALDILTRLDAPRAARLRGRLDGLDQTA